MATSRSPHPLRRDPFQKPTLTPGPLGRNDAASPDTPRSFVGDTPGPLGVRDYAAPNSRSKPRATEDTARKTARDPKLMSVSDRGVKFIWDEEYVRGVSEHVHWPRGASGVTLGAGYDMKTRTKKQVIADLKSTGLSERACGKAAEGAGLAGEAAESFVYDNWDKFELNEDQSLSLLRLILSSYVSVVKRLVKVPLLQHEFDALVSFAYNPGGRLRNVAISVNKGNVSDAMSHIAAATTSGGRVLKGLVARRIREINLYLSGRYTR